MKKVSVSVLAQFGSAGQTHPLSVTWTDGRVFPIESVLDLRPARTDPDRFRYTVLIHGQEAYLYRSGDRWFMESAE